MRLLLIVALLTPLLAQAQVSHQQGQNTGISALSQMRLSTKLDGTSLFKDRCTAESVGRFSPKEALAASGYNRRGVPYAAIDNPQPFCECALRVASEANRVAAGRLGMKAGPMPTDDEMRKAIVLSSNNSGFTACQGGPWRVDFTPAGLALWRDAAPVFGGEKQLIAGKTVERTSSVSESWDQD